jgi:hypothetical protein
VINLEVPIFTTVEPEVFYLMRIIFSILLSLFLLYYIVCFVILSGYEEDFKHKMTLNAMC